MRPLHRGRTAPGFELPDQDGNLVRLADLLATGPVTLFFYPAASTPGCTAQACRFRDLAGEFRAAGGLRVGISRDPVGRQRRFAERHRLGFPVLSDASGQVAAAYGVRRGLLRVLAPVRRVTFVIARDGRIAEVVADELDMAAHAERALVALAQLDGV